MSDPAIRVEGVCKRYLLGSSNGRGRGLRETLEENLRNPLRLFSKSKKQREAEEEFWALKDVSFDVNQGEVIGIIGRNGAGKSTLLKILSRITEPTRGRVTLNGRVASLLEVGTGFHPELTGRENVFLNGAILGMTRSEINRKFDEIVAFSEIERFIDTPVKRYSSGMYVRLAFAVASHLEPEILIVDEVLAVGDTQFQIKCLDRIRSISESGRTVLIVSHSLSSVRTLCHTAALLEKGRLLLKDDPGPVIGTYLAAHQTGSGLWTRSSPVPDASGVFFEKISISPPGGEPTADFNSDQDIMINIGTIATKLVSNVQLGIRVTNQEGIAVFTTCNTDEARQFIPLPEGRQAFNVTIPAVLLPQGRYTLEIVSHVPHDRQYDFLDSELSFFVHDVGSHATILKDSRTGVVNPLFPWRMQTK